VVHRDPTVPNDTCYSVTGNIRLQEARCHLLVTRIWHPYLLHSYRSLDTMVRRMTTCQHVNVTTQISGVYHLLPMCHVYEFWCEPSAADVPCECSLVWTICYTCTMYIYEVCCVPSANHVPCTRSLVCTICYLSVMSVWSDVYHLLPLSHVREVWCVPSANQVSCMWGLMCTICYPSVMYVRSDVYHLLPMCHVMNSGVNHLLHMCHVHEVWCVPSATLVSYAWSLVCTIYHHRAMELE